MLNRAKYYYENNKSIKKKKQEISIENYLKKKRMGLTVCAKFLAIINMCFRPI